MIVSSDMFIFVTIDKPMWNCEALEIRIRICLFSKSQYIIYGLQYTYKRIYMKGGLLSTDNI